MGKQIYKILCNEATPTNKINELYNDISTGDFKEYFHTLEVENNYIYVESEITDIKFLMQFISSTARFLADVKIENVHNVTIQYEKQKQFEEDQEYLRHNHGITLPIPELQKSYEDSGITPKELYEWALEYGIENIPIITYRNGAGRIDRRQAYVYFNRRGGNLEVEGIAIL